jgi:methionine-S-sulfoxide reductase
VLRTRAGYCGGTKENPTYRSLGDHSETIQMDFDPERVSYTDLLEIFWRSHEPEYRSWSRQYASFIFFHDEEQHDLALRTKEREEDRLKKKIYTTLVPYTIFYPAEDYHQKYYLRRQPGIMADFNRMYPDARDFMNSTAAARINGYVAGCGTPERLGAELASFGLTDEGGRRLVDIVDYRRR